MEEHIFQLTHKLRKAYYIRRVFELIMSIDSLKSVYYTYFQYFITYGIIFWSNSSYSFQIFRLHKRIIRIMSGLRLEGCKGEEGSQFVVSLWSNVGPET